MLNTAVVAGREGKFGSYSSRNVRLYEALLWRFTSLSTCLRVAFPAFHLHGELVKETK